MMFKSKLATFVGALVLAGSSFAGQQAECPSIDAIKGEGISMAEEIGPNIFITYNISTYNTESNWGFIIAPLQSDSDEEALDEANEILDSMTAPGVPQQHSGATVCEYDTGRQDIFAAAISDDSGMITPMRLKHFIKRTH